MHKVALRRDLRRIAIFSAENFTGARFFFAQFKPPPESVPRAVASEPRNGCPLATARGPDSGGGPIDRFVIRRGQHQLQADHKRRKMPGGAIPNKVPLQAHDPDSQKQLIRNYRTTTSMNRPSEAA